MATNDKPTIYYRVVNGHNPSNLDEVIKRPVITRRENYSIGRVIKAAIDSGRIRGKFYDLNGIVNGFMDQVKVLLEEGKSVNANFMRLHAELAGQLGASEMITTENTLTTCVTPLAELKLDIDKFNWQRVDDNGIKLTISTIKGEGCKIGTIKSNATARINGRNCFMSAGDSVTLKLGDELVFCEVLASDEDTIEVMIPEIDEAYFNTDTTLTVNSHCGLEDGALQSKSLTVKVLASEASKKPRIVSVTSSATGRDGEWHAFADEMTVKVANAPGQDATLNIDLIEKATGEIKTRLLWCDGNSVERVDESTFKINVVANPTPIPDGLWTDASQYEVHLTLTSDAGNDTMFLTTTSGTL